MNRTTARHHSSLRALSAVLPVGLSVLCLASLLSTSVIAQPPAVDLPAPATYEAEYQARAMGMSTEAYRRLEPGTDGQFSLSHGLSVSVLGANLITVEERSEFNWDSTGAIPLAYHYKQSGVRRRDEHVVFGWDASEPAQSTATMTRDDREQSLAIGKATLDNLSFSAQLSADLMHKPELRAVDTVLSYQILDARRLETHEYRVLGEERINTPAGALDTIKLERIRDIESERTTLIWLSAAHQYTLARLSQTEGGGSAMELTLTQITWTGGTDNGAE